MAFAFVPQTDAAIIAPSDRAELLRDLNASMYGMNGVVSETKVMGTGGVSIEIEGIRMHVDFQSRNTRELEEDAFMEDAMRDYPALSTMFTVIAYILHRRGWMFTRPRHGPVTPRALSAILVSFFDVSVADLCVPIGEN